LVKRIVKELQLKKKVVAVTALTGIAAMHIGGRTLHSFAGIGLGEGTKKELAAKAINNPTVRDRWRNADVLLVDEVSMLDDSLLLKIDHVPRQCRGLQPSKGGASVLSPEPMGGMQVIMVGDFFQLPPVVRGAAHLFAFEGRTWAKLRLLPVQSEKVRAALYTLRHLNTTNSLTPLLSPSA
jgi:ATP-dependent DNA helicase PIF1